MEKLVLVSGKKMIKVLLSAGFQLLRIKGSHHFFENKETGKITVIPVHNNEVLGVGILKEILKDIGMSVDDYDRLRLKR